MRRYVEEHPCHKKKAIAGLFTSRSSTFWMFLMLSSTGLMCHRLFNAKINVFKSDGTQKQASLGSGWFILVCTTLFFACISSSLQLSQDSEGSDHLQQLQIATCTQGCCLLNKFGTWKRLILHKNISSKKKTRIAMYSENYMSIILKKKKCYVPHGGV